MESSFRFLALGEEAVCRTIAAVTVPPLSPPSCRRRLRRPAIVTTAVTDVKTLLRMIFFLVCESDSRRATDYDIPKVADCFDAMAVGRECIPAALSSAQQCGRMCEVIQLLVVTLLEHVLALVPFPGRPSRSQFRR